MKALGTTTHQDNAQHTGGIAVVVVVMMWTAILAMERAKLKKKKNETRNNPLQPPSQEGNTSGEEVWNTNYLPILVTYRRDGIFNDINLKTGTMKEEEIDEILTQTVNGMMLMGVSEHFDGTPLKMIFLGLSSALAATSSEQTQASDDMKDSAITMLETMKMVIESSRFMVEVDIQNQIDDLLK